MESWRWLPFPFYSKENPGMGLRMAMAKKAVEGHHGKIHIDSKMRVGTEAIIELPCRLMDEKRKEPGSLMQ